MQKDRIIKLTYLFIVSIFMFSVWCGTANAATSNCTDTKSGKFTFSVEPGITITATNTTLQSICPGCTRTWDCGIGSYIEFDITGSPNCLYIMHHDDALYLSSDFLAGLSVAWEELFATGWVQIPNDPPTLPAQQFLVDQNGFGYAKYRAYVIVQHADCNASGTYTWSYTVTVNYTCPLLSGG